MVSWCCWTNILKKTKDFSYQGWAEAGLYQPIRNICVWALTLGTGDTQSLELLQIQCEHSQEVAVTLKWVGSCSLSVRSCPIPIPGSSPWTCPLPARLCFSVWETLIMLPAPLWDTRLWVSSYCCALLLLNSALWINKTQWLHFLHLRSQCFKWLSQRTCWFVGAFQAVAENNFYRNECEKRTELLVVLKEYWEWLVLNHWKNCFFPLVLKL